MHSRKDKMKACYFE